MKQFILRCRRQFFYAALFSGCVNLLLLTSSFYMLQVFDRVFSSRSLETLLMLTIAAVVALLVMMALDTLRTRLLLASGMTLDQAIGPRILRGLLNAASEGNDADHAMGMRDVAVVRGFLSGSGVIALFDAPWVPVYLAVIFLFHPALGWLALLCAAVLFLVAWVNEKMTRPPTEEMQRRARLASRYIDGGIRNAEAIRALGMLERVCDRWQKLNHNVLEAQAGAGRVSGVIGGLSRFIRQAVQVLMMAAGAYLVVHQDMTSGGMIAITIILSRALAPVEQAIASWKGFIDFRASYRRLDELLRKNPEFGEPVQLPPPTGAVQVEKLVVVRDQMQILKGLNFEVTAGEVVGIIGPSGAGKSTLLRALAGVWRPAAGNVRLDGADLSVWPREYLGQFVGYLPQDVELFPGTVAENIARFTEASDESVVEAAQRAGAHEMILRLAQGYNAQIGESGSHLSAGQRQRVGLARAMFGSPKLMILDEPNANLDAEGEMALMQAIATLKKAACTVILVSHKPSIMAGADKLMVLREGRIELFGPRQEVLAKLAPPAIQPRPRDTGSAPQAVSS
jgi:PrtD family type I secretion system ABC transporter